MLTVKSMSDVFATGTVVKSVLPTNVLENGELVCQKTTFGFAIPLNGPMATFLAGQVGTFDHVATGTTPTGVNAKGKVTYRKSSGQVKATTVATFLPDYVAPIPVPLDADASVNGRKTNGRTRRTRAAK